jgi:hypothetical protein
VPIPDPSQVIAAGIAAIPATFAAYASWKAAKQVKPSNGHRLAETVEFTKERVVLALDRLESHIMDQQAHARECHRASVEAEGCCPDCLGLLTEGGEDDGSVA